MILKITPHIIDYPSWPAISSLGGERMNLKFEELNYSRRFRKFEECF